MPAPAVRIDHALAYDSDRGVSVLFGGLSGMVLLADTWEWNGTTWSARSSSDAPSGRRGHAMAYYSARHATVLFGGYGGGYSSETWEWTSSIPFISQQPTDKSVATGQTATFTVAASSPNTLTYHWRKGGNLLSDVSEITGSTTPTLTINPVAAGNAGTYDCQISNTCDTVTSHSAVLSLSSSADGCGLCGAGLAMMMPLSILGLAVLSRKGWYRVCSRNEEDHP
jgi:hypothetical protein